MSAAVVVRPMFLVLDTVQATATYPQLRTERKRMASSHFLQASLEQAGQHKSGAAERGTQQASNARTPPTPAADREGHPFYRKYTEGMLRRYSKLSMESGRVPSMLGKEMFRGRVTSYKVQSFDDVVIFVKDVEGCLGKLSLVQRLLIERIALQGYTQGETAALLGISLRTVIRRYNIALDDLTRVFLRRNILQPLQGYSVKSLLK